MKKKLLTILLSVFMIATAFTTRVFAAGNVAKIESTEYATLNEAINAVNDGETITIIDDITYTVGPNFVINEKTVTIDFDGHSLTVNTGMSIPPFETKIFTVTNTGNLTVKNGAIVCSGMYGGGMLEPFTVSGTLTLIDITQTSNLGHFLTISGGIATINGGTFGTSGSSNGIGIKLSNNATINVTNNPTFNSFQGSLFTLGESVSDPDTPVGNINIDSGTFDSSNDGAIVLNLNGNANVTINGGTYIATGTNTNSSLMFIGTYGYKSNVTINDFTSNSGQVFRSDCSNISEFAPIINNGHYKYIKGKFALDNDGTSKPNVKLNDGYFGPVESSAPVADDDALAEVNAICASGYHADTLADTDSEYTNGYRYKIVAGSPTPPTPPAPTPEPDPEPDPAPVYVIPNTGVEGTTNNNHSLLKLSSLSLLAIGTYMVIKNKKDN